MVGQSSRWLSASRRNTTSAGHGTVAPAETALEAGVGVASGVMLCTMDSMQAPRVSMQPAGPHHGWGDRFTPWVCAFLPTEAPVTRTGNQRELIRDDALHYAKAP